MFKTIITGLGIAAALFAVLIFSGKIPVGSGNTAKGPTGEVKIWGTLPQDTIDKILSNLNLAVKTYRVTYQEIPENKLPGVLLNALADGNGPDMLLAPYQIILKEADRIQPFPYAVISEKAYKDNYVDGASIFLTPYGALALPVSIEPMVLFFNRELLSKHLIVNPPEYWDELTNMTPSLTVKNRNGEFFENAISFGSTNNDPYAKDFIMTLVSQFGQTPVYRNYTQKGATYNVSANDEITSAKVRPLANAIRYYAQFSDPLKQTYTWNYAMPNAIDSFVAEKLAMYVGYSSEMSLIKSVNQKINFDMTYLPQAKGYGTASTGMRLYGIATLRQSRLMATAQAAQSALAGSPYSIQIAQSIAGISPIKAISQSDPNVPEVAKRSSLIARGWYDINVDGSTNLFNILMQEIVSGKRDLNDAVDGFVIKLSNLFNS